MDSTVNLPVCRDWRLLASRRLDANADARSCPAAVSEDESLPDSYHRLFRWWFVFGFPAFAAVLGIFWFMIARPAIPFWDGD
jgi:uncharacterized membrane protein